MDTGTVKVVIIAKNAAQRTVSGYAYVSKDAAGVEVVDHSGQSIDVQELSRAVREFVKNGAVAGEMHQGDAPNPIVEAITFTPEILDALPIGSEEFRKEARAALHKYLPQGTFITVEVPEATFQKISERGYMAFSIEGQAIETEVRA